MLSFREEYNKVFKELQTYCKGEDSRNSVEDCDSAIWKINSYNYLYQYEGSDPIVYVPSGVKHISCKRSEGMFWGAFEFKRIKQVFIPDSVITLGTNAFAYCVELEFIKWSNNLESIGLSTFEGCSELTSIKLPDSVTSIGDKAFYGCSSLKSIILSNKLEDIGSHAFMGCENLTEITIPSTVTKIGAFALDCKNLKTVYNYSKVDLHEDTSYRGNYYSIPDTCKIIDK